MSRQKDRYTESRQSFCFRHLTLNTIFFMVSGEVAALVGTLALAIAKAPFYFQSGGSLTTLARQLLQNLEVNSKEALWGGCFIGMLHYFYNLNNKKPHEPQIASGLFLIAISEVMGALLISRDAEALPNALLTGLAGTTLTTAYLCSKI